MEKSKPSSGSDKSVQPLSAVSQSESAYLAQGPLAVVPVLLKVHLWTAGGGDASESARAMVDDLLSTCQCEVRDGGPSFKSAWFEDTMRAVTVVRRIQRLVKGYSRASKKGYLGGCFILAGVDETNQELEKRLLLRLPTMTGGHSPVFITGTLYQSARAIPGLRFQPANDEWMLPESVFQLMPPTHMEGYVEEPVELPAPAVERKQTESAAVPLAFEAPLINGAGARGPSPLAGAALYAAGDVKGASIYRTDDQLKQAFPFVWAALGSVLLIALGAVALQISHSPKSQPPVKTVVVPPQSSSPQPLPAPTLMPSVNPVPTSPSNPTPETTSTGAKPTKKSGRNEISDKKLDTPPAPKEPKVDKTRGVRFTASDVPGLLARATKHSGDGDFDEAIREYNIVLGIERDNAQAREGLNRARLNQAQQ